MRTILHPTDFDHASDRAFALAVAIARRTGASIKVLHVSPTFGEDPITGAYQAAVDQKDFDRRVVEQSERQMSEMIRSAGVDDIDVDHIHARGHDPGEAIVQFVNQTQLVDLIVMGTHGRKGVGRLFLGSVAERVINASVCPVITCRGDSESAGEPFDRILVPMDFSQHSLNSLRMAHELCVEFQAELHVLHVIEPFAMPVSLTGVRTMHELVPDIELKVAERLAESVAGLEGSYVPYQIHTAKGNASTTILAYANSISADLIAISPIGLGAGQGDPIGRTAERIIRGSECPVYVAGINTGPAAIKPLAKTSATQTTR